MTELQEHTVCKALEYVLEEATDLPGDVQTHIKILLDDKDTNTLDSSDYELILRCIDIMSQSYRSAIDRVPREGRVMMSEALAQLADARTAASEDAKRKSAN